ncbi:hypothetical protein HBI26_091720 [Parastagonospora nodorum]|nr:hypothetical protein HBI26_091720 [Parastagonospora nodorum]KAH6494451.1 hypothetical protein HBI55_113080 [Parastagonospora nodorum]
MITSSSCALPLDSGSLSPKYQNCSPTAASMINTPAAPRKNGVARRTQFSRGLSSGGGGRDGVVGDGAGVVWGRGEGADGFCEGGLREDGEDEGDVQHGLGRGHG